MADPLPRFQAACRRDFLKRAAALGAAALVPGALVSCAKSDEEVFGSSPTTTTPDTTAPETTTPDTTAPETTAPETTAPATSGSAAVPDSAMLEVAFTYTADGGRGPARNPFIAVWVEDAAGTLVATVSLWYNPPKGNRWINELTNWYAAESAVYDTNGGGDLDAVTGATRPAGSFTVAWDGSDLDGDRVRSGEYTVFVESAREHGPHSLTSASIRLGSTAADVSLADEGELSNASASYTT